MRPSGGPRSVLLGEWGAGQQSPLTKCLEPATPRHADKGEAIIPSCSSARQGRLVVRMRNRYVVAGFAFMALTLAACAGGGSGGSRRFDPS